MTRPDPRPAVVAIGDVHGCATLLREAIWPHLGSGAGLLLLGDLIDRSPEPDGDRQVIELVRALLLHMRTSEGKEWVDITNMPKAAHMLQRKRPVVGVSLRWGSRDVGPEEWQRLMAEIRARHGKLANFLSKHSSVFELRSRPGGKVLYPF